MSCKTLLNMSLSLQLLPHLPTTFSHTDLLSVSWICQAPSHQTFTAFRLFPGSYPSKFSTPHPANTYSSCRSQLKYHFLKLSFLGFPSLSSSLLFFCKTLASSLPHTHTETQQVTDTKKIDDCLMSVLLDHTFSGASGLVMMPVTTVSPSPSTVVVHNKSSIETRWMNELKEEQER